MKKYINYLSLLVIVISLSAFSYHKFYVGIFQINHAPEKKMLQITARLFIDDLNKALEKKYKVKTAVGTDNEGPSDNEYLKRYLNEGLVIKANDKVQKVIFLSKEVDQGDVLICYLKIQGLEKFKSLEISNTVLIDWNSEQQNITHITAMGVKKTVLFTDSSKKELLKY